MNRIILCEGYDDAVFLGYYLYKITDRKYQYNSKRTEVSENLHLPKCKARNERREIYEYNNDCVLIWAVGGKDSYEKAITYISKISKDFPDERFTDIFIVTDRDNSDIDTSLIQFSELFIKNGIDIELKNNNINTYEYYTEDSISYDIHIIPIVIPFEEQGAIETVLLNSLSEKKEEAIIVDEAKKYVYNIENNSEVTSYLRHDREKVKARFSAAMSVINPDHSTGTMNTILISQEWENTEEIKKHFVLIKDIFQKSIVRS
ncbi:MAG: DUF3226 domain-containing protein [Clostridia bacterium]|nr:DUF3226 domain-containing protein [Clostridia bacterium]